MNDVWNITLQLGNWHDSIQVSKVDFPKAVDAHQFVIDTTSKALKEMKDNPLGVAIADAINKHNERESE